MLLKPLSFLLLAGLLGSGLSQKARTYYDGLDFSTPQKTTSLFLQAYQKSDYLTVFYCLSPRAQQAWASHLMAFDFTQILRGSGTDIVKASGILDAPEESEVMLDLSLQFDRVMLAAEQLQGLPFQLKASNIQNSKVQGTTATLQAQNAVVPRQLTFKLTRLKNARWKIDQVLFSGSRPNVLPWGVGTD
ncbi:hypothetical protein [Deinococcus cellulosilyticus]|uniref:Uncharacterized protein n=1 Tax=Deinococcus cellulosilyticus (strain DSM 18568 / NBRC 106333 / KACC 11606 / 5516J-15) TaxID=1223518 RepID=A0A511NBW8_DEIC1|nr:hypothetical protein [Deinococcus cellulosilyticus]GEM49861.1 hypothetical protein DC3_54960 [Deinococcus cellulosilyticus NBRC 106333 = KACC 11606]